MLQIEILSQVFNKRKHLKGIFILFYPVLFLIGCHLLTDEEETSPQQVVSATSEPTSTVAGRATPEGVSGFTPTIEKPAKTYLAITANPYASETAEKILSGGGTAVDALAASQFVLGLVEPQSSGIGGGGFLVYYDAKSKKIFTYDGRETAPSQIPKNVFSDATGKALPFFDAVIGGSSVGTPGLVKLLETAHQKHGKTAWKDLIKPAVKLAKNGFKVSKRLHALVSKDLERLKKGGDGFQYLTSMGAPRPVGTILKNPDYASALQEISEKGGSVFYEGKISNTIVKTIKSHQRPGYLETHDLKNYKVLKRPPVCSLVLGLKMCGMGPPSSGPFTVIQSLKIYESAIQKFGGKEISPTLKWHVFLEAQRLAFADRDTYLADPDFIHVPTEKLLEESYISKRASLIGKAPLKEVRPGKFAKIENPYHRQPELPSTTHITIVDNLGNVVSFTSSIESAFGSRLFTNGFFLNNQLTDFYFLEKKEGKLLANRVEPGKRPRSSMSPMILFDPRSDTPVFSVGSPGGSRIIGYVAGAIFKRFVLGWSLQQIVNSPNILKRYEAVEMEKQEDLAGNDDSVQFLAEKLIQMGHTVKRVSLTSGLALIEWQKDGLLGIADPRREGVALGK